MTPQDRLPDWFKYSLLPLFVPPAAAAYTAALWNQIPPRFPVHWGANGQPNHWITRTPLHVFGLFIFAEGLCLWLIVMGMICYRGARPSRERTTTLKAGFGVEWLMAVVFSGVGMSAALRFPVWPWITVIPLPAIAIAVLLWKASSEPGDSSEVPSGAGDLFVPKAFGYGYTLNFANPRAKWVMLWIIGGIGSLAAFLFFSLH